MQLIIQSDVITHMSLVFSFAPWVPIENRPFVYLTVSKAIVAFLYIVFQALQGVVIKIFICDIFKNSLQEASCCKNVTVLHIFHRSFLSRSHFRSLREKHVKRIQ